VAAHDGEFLANAALASRKDVRDAVRAARAAVGGWSGATAYNRGQILYRVAEMLEGRRAQFVDEVRAGEGWPRAAEATVDAAIDRWVWYAGWSDKVAQVYGNANPVAGPYFNLTTPEPPAWSASWPRRLVPARLVSVVAPGDRDRQHLRRAGQRGAPAAGDHAGRGAGHSDLPGGVVNLLTGRLAETSPWLAGHMDVNAIDLTGCRRPRLATELESPRPRTSSGSCGRTRADWTRTRAGPDVDLPGAKTVWHPKGI
jgi:hypothetical protein